MKKIFLSLFFAVGLSLVGMSDNLPPPISGSPEPIPVDGGISLLLAAGAAYGVKKVRDRKAKKSGETTEEN
jgi:hypothetical protein